MTKTIRINEKFLETCGTGTLIGTVGHDSPIADIKEVILQFEETPLFWRVKNKGPALWVMPEYVVSLLIEDVLWLTNKGIKVKIDTIEVER